MARTYSTRVVALAIGVPAKWLDNLLSHVSLPGVAGGRRGVERRIDDAGILAIEIARLLHQELGMTLDLAASVAQAMVVGGADDARYKTASGLVLSLPRSTLESRLRARLADALESAPRIKRGRRARG